MECCFLKCNSSSNVRENTQTTEKGRNAVTIRRCETDYPLSSVGEWSGNIYRIIAVNGKVMYESSPFPDSSHLKTPTTSTKGDMAAVKFRDVPDNIRLIEYFP